MSVCKKKKKFSCDLKEIFTNKMITSCKEEVALRYDFKEIV